MIASRFPGNDFEGQACFEKDIDEVILYHISIDNWKFVSFLFSLMKVPQFRISSAASCHTLQLFFDSEATKAIATVNDLFDYTLQSQSLDIGSTDYLVRQSIDQIDIEY
jgi:hypothetical protein